jgi:hypothetical protein
MAIPCAHSWPAYVSTLFIFNEHQANGAVDAHLDIPFISTRRRRFDR